MKSYQATIEFLFRQLPLFQHIGAGAYKSGLETTRQLCSLLGDPQKSFRCIHLAGTNGKGSCSHLLASIMQERGLKTGLFTSPHLKDFRERIRVNGSMISKTSVVAFMKNYERDFAPLKPSFFELTFAMAMQYFHSQKVDIAVIETGMGGRLDATNILDPMLSVITNISYDHKMFLGDTLQKIAREKAGIIKAGIPVVAGETQPETTRIFINRAKQKKCKLVFADKRYHALMRDSKSGKGMEMLVISENTGKTLELVTSLGGFYQLRNTQTVLSAIEILNESGLQITDENIQQGFKKVMRNTGLKGRWHILSAKPLTICDTAHNEAGIRYIVEQLKSIPYKKLHIVFGMVQDKDSGAILELLPKDACYYFCCPAISRGLDAEILSGRAAAAGLTGQVFPSVMHALDSARNHAGDEDLIFAGGSTFVVAEII